MRQEFSQVQTIQLLISADVQMMMSINKSCYFGVWNCEAFVTFVILLFYNLIISVIFIALAAYLIISSFFLLFGVRIAQVSETIWKTLYCIKMLWGLASGFAHQVFVHHVWNSKIFIFQRLQKLFDLNLFFHFLQTINTVQIPHNKHIWKSWKLVKSLIYSFMDITIAYLKPMIPMIVNWLFLA